MECNAGYTKRLKTQRGKVSLLFLGNDSPAPGTLIKLDHGKKKVLVIVMLLRYSLMPDIVWG